MPELPDVEIYRQTAKKAALGRKIQSVTVTEKRILEEDTKKLEKQLVGKEFSRETRIGKHLFLRAGKQWLMLHFGMTGRLEPFEDEPPEYARLIIDFKDGSHLAFINKRLLGKVELVESPEKFADQHGLGPDAKEIDEKQFLELLKAKKGGIKSALMNQEFLAGLGNVYSDEVLFQAKIHPRQKVKNLSKKELVSIFREIGKVIRTAIKHKADPEKMPSSFITPCRGKQGKCPACGNRLKTIKVSGRTTYYCPKEQKE